MLVTLSEALKKACKGRYAVGAFNVNNLEAIQAVMDASEAERSPVILSTSEGAIQYAGMEELGLLARLAAARTKVPVVFHLDHGKDVALIETAIKSGLYTSVMFDGSSLPFEENVKATSRLVKLAHKHGVSLEAELGAIAGIEDFVSVEAKDAHLTQPSQATTFVRRTGCDALAIAVGTSHGAYKFKKASELDFPRLKALAEAVNVPLVLHGASSVPSWVKSLCTKFGCEIAGAKGVSEAHVKKAVGLGVCKVNVDTDLRIAFDAGIRKFLATHPQVIDPREILAPAKALMTRVVRQKMRLLGSSGKG
ncbi:fructose-1,6-bisphosphate aldolase, class II [Candidatus Uhrbacteria bacterium RIFCSPHIGHO2_01_FULL_63_20]|uniref:Fructose-1,6-bisphosphate aldolase, class II n=1 Tax=Candidatus Uhrbacteria bacterium RIFCSPHIGHO2_01_FULL_63_20 TaxID=1802385 RepID=A0A1F7TLW9_9BACT|nr:MAG: fructose-1,6-bisphosphate aldolase, class II [Candidatus Uhrbacteria bacterium RIFCSPHIGHO2_01_FULL_63_20]